MRCLLRANQSAFAWPAWCLAGLGLAATMAAQENADPRERLLVAAGQPVHVVYTATPWQPREGYLEGAGADNWLLADRGLAEGDFLIRARLAIHGLKHSAARFSFDGQHSFGFEGNHGRIYITNRLAPPGQTSLAHCTPAEAGIVDGREFLFEVRRGGNRIEFLVDGRSVYAADVSQYTFDCFGFEPRRAAIRLVSFEVRGNLSPEPYRPEIARRWNHPACAVQDTAWHGPFIGLPDDGLLTVVNVAGGIQSFTSHDDGSTWQPAGRISHPETAFRIRDLNGDVLLLRTPGGDLLCVFLNIADEKISWDRERQEPNPDIKRFTWISRSPDNGQTWAGTHVLQEGYCGALRDGIVLRGGDIVLVGQDVARNPGRNVSFTHASGDDGRTWVRSNTLDIGGRGDHDGCIEGTLVERRDGTLWMLLRSYHGHFYESTSADRGRTWVQPPVASPIAASGSPGILKRLASGRIILLWNRFAKDRPPAVGRREELSVAFSEDDGATWTPPLVILRERNKRQSYPQVFERRPGELWITTWQGQTFVKAAESALLAASAAEPVPETPVR